MFSAEVVSLFQDLLNAYNLPANHPSFDVLAVRISQARSELENYHRARQSEPQSEEYIEEGTDTQEKEEG